MSTAHMTRPPQTLYVTIRRDELRQLKDERDQLSRKSCVCARTCRASSISRPAPSPPFAERELNEPFRNNSRSFHIRLPILPPNRAALRAQALCCVRPCA